ncbi:MAG: hypothetical protein QE271_13995 [Bacteriovoracaceae bacterium]|nr:hypothetical protein [Bacteriovoracaceae bacterium]
MKFLALSFLILNIGFAFGAEARTHSNCSNADATVQYATRDGERRLTVTAKKINADSSVVFEKKVIKNFVVTEVKKVFIEETQTTNCKEVDWKEGTLTVKTINFRRVIFQNESGAAFQNNIIGLTDDKTVLPVDYICETVTKSSITCD